VKAVARAYMAEYAAARWGGMAKLMAEDFELVDRTQPRPNPRQAPRTAVQTLSLLRRFGEDNGVSELGLEFSDVFASGEMVVFIGHVNAQGVLPGGGQAYRWRARLVCAITVRGGKVVRHEEFVDCSNPEISRWPVLASQV